MSARTTVLWMMVITVERMSEANSGRCPELNLKANGGRERDEMKRDSDAGERCACKLRIKDIHNKVFFCIAVNVSSWYL